MTPHQSTGESPFFLMFGQEPRLPIDFLLGRVESPVSGSIHEWVQERMAPLQVAFEGARECLKHAANRRKRVHDQQVRDLPLPEGQLVYLRDFSTRGPQKTQNRWSSVKYRVLWMPQKGGSVYSIVPVDNETKDQPRPKHLHPALGPSSCPPSPTSTDSSSMGLCRTTRQTAGQHSNVHCFPWPAGDVPVANPSASVSHSVSALFRPWS